MSDISNTDILLSNDTFRDMYQRYIDYKKLEGSEPGRVYLHPGKEGDYVSNERFQDMMNRVLLYKEGPAVYIKPTTAPTTPETPVTPSPPPKPEGEDISNWDGVLDRKTFISMLLWYWDYRKTQGKEPICVYLPNSKKYIMLDRFNDMRTRYEVYEQEHGGGSTKVIGISKPASAVSTGSNFLNKFNKAVESTVITFTDGYNAIKNRVYSFYNNDVYPQATALERLHNRTGLNCCDISQIMYQLAKELGYEVRYVHIKCKSGIGHLLLDVKGKELGNSWKRVDPAAALKSGYNLGNTWCPDGSVIGYNPGWMLSDDGIT